MQVTLLGTGDTTGTPTPGCECETCQRARDPDDALRRRMRERGIDADVSIQRSRFSVHVRNEHTGESLLIDASPDFRQQFLTHDVDLPDEILVTHVHFDHLDGLGNTYRLLGPRGGGDAPVPVHAAGGSGGDDGESVAAVVADRYDYLDTVAVRSQEPLVPFEAAGFRVRLVPVDHPPLPCYGVVLEDPETGAKLSLSGDTSYAIPDESRAALADPDLLLADALVPAHLCEHHPLGGRHEGDDGIPRTFGTKHMTREGALALGEDLDADRVRLVHVAHYYPAEEAFEDPLAVDGEYYEL